MYSPYSSSSHLLLTLLLPTLLLGIIPSSADPQRDENPPEEDYAAEIVVLPTRRPESEQGDDYADEPSETEKQLQDLLKNTKIELLSCCNKTRKEVKTSIQELLEKINPKLADLAAKTDIEVIIDNLSELANKSAIEQLQGTVDALPTIETIQTYTQNINDKFTNLVDQLEINITELAESTKTQFSNETHKITQVLDHIVNIAIVDLQVQMQNNADTLEKRLDILSTFEDIKNLTVLMGNLATKKGMNITTNNLSMSIFEVQTSVDEIKVNLTKLVNKHDIENITYLVESLATKESLESLQGELNLLSKEETLKNLTKYVSNQIANKDDVLETKAEITTSTSEIVKEISVLKDNFSNLALSIDIQNLSKTVLGIDEKLGTSKQDVSKIMEMLQKLQNKQKEQSNKLEELIANVAKTSTSQELENVEQLIRSLQTTSDTTLVAVKGITNTNYSPSLELDKSQNDCMESSLFTEQIDSLKSKVDNKCSIDNIKEDLEEMEDRLQKRLENITLSENPCPSLTTEPSVIEAGTCEDSVFINSPHDLDVCSAVVKRRLCNTDPLIGFHCCTSCVFDRQIPSDGPHRYVKAPRKVNYKAEVHAIVGDKKNY